MIVTRKSRGRPKSFDDNEALLSAMNYFWEHGYDNSSLDNLLLAMGIKKSSFYSTFKSKEDLFSSCLDLYRQKMLSQLTMLEKEIGPKETMLMLTAMLIKELKETGKVKGCLLMNSGQECYNKYGGLSQQVAVEFSFMMELFTGFVEAAKHNGEIISTKDAKNIAARYLTALNGLIVIIQAGVGQDIVDDIVENLKEILE